jgi:hypothetical protein
MAEDKKSFIVYTDSKSLVNKLPDNVAGKLFKMLFAYTCDENPTTEDPLLDIAFEHFKQKLKKDLAKWQEIKKQRSLAGKASAKKRKQKETKATSVKSVEQNSTNPTVSVNGNVNVIVNDILLEKETKEIFKTWIDYRKEIKKTVKSEKTIISLAKKIQSEGAKKSTEVINLSIQNGWMGLFWDNQKNGIQKKEIAFNTNR